MWQGGIFEETMLSSATGKQCGPVGTWLSPPRWGPYILLVTEEGLTGNPGATGLGMNPSSPTCDLG